MLEIKNYSKSYGNKLVVDNISLKVDAGDIYAFIGHNGAGKTTTIKSIIGILDFNEGEILINNISIKEDPLKCKKIIAYVPDNPDLYDFLSGIDYLNFIADIFEISKEKREEIIKKYATELDLINNLGDKIGSYSHGMKQKLVIISALIHEPKLMILDEPFVGLDPSSSHKLKEIMKNMCQNGSAIFFSTHVLEVAEKLCNKIAVIQKGKIVASGEMKKIIKDKSLEDVFLELYNHE